MSCFFKVITSPGFARSSTVHSPEADERALKDEMDAILTLEPETEQSADIVDRAL